MAETEERENENKIEERERRYGAEIAWLHNIWVSMQNRVCGVTIRLYSYYFFLIILYTLLFIYLFIYFIF